jgi:hypothetical protein
VIEARVPWRGEKGEGGRKREEEEGVVRES